VQGIIKALALDEDMVRVSVTPLFHAMGLTVNMLAVVFLGASAVIQAKLDFEEFLKANEKYKATMISGAPTSHYMLMNDPGLPIIAFPPGKWPCREARPFPWRC